MTRQLLIVAALAGLALSGCARVTAEECRAADWRSVGYAHGADGRAKTEIRRLSGACAKIGVSADLTAYEAGHAAGLSEYCTPSGAYRAAREGYPYLGLCPAAGREFHNALIHGQNYYRISREIRRTEYAWPYHGYGHISIGHHRRHRHHGFGYGLHFPLFPPYPYYSRHRLDELNHKLEYYANWPPIG